MPVETLTEKVNQIDSEKNEFEQETQPHCDIFRLCGWRIKNWSNKKQIIFTNKPKLTKSISMETLSTKFEPNVLEINQLEHRHTKEINWTFLHIQLMNIPIKGTELEFVPSEKHSKRRHCQFRPWQTNSKMLFSRRSKWNVKIIEH